MTTEQKKMLELHKGFMETGRMCEDGLCAVISERVSKASYRLFESRMEPTWEAYKDIFSDDGCTSYWGSGLGSFHKNVHKGYTELRQNLFLLFIYAYQDLK